MLHVLPSSTSFYLLFSSYTTSKLPLFFSLYLGVLGTNMPCGPHVVRKAANGFTPEKREKHLVSYIWMDYVAKTEGIVITHRLSAGREVKIQGMAIDGFAQECQRIFEFDGCWLVPNTLTRGRRGSELTFCNLCLLP